MDASVLVVHKDLTASEKKAANAVAEEIAGYHSTGDKDPAHHLPESEAIMLMLRRDLGAIELLYAKSTDSKSFNILNGLIPGFFGIGSYY